MKGCSPCTYGIILTAGQIPHGREQAQRVLKDHLCVQYLLRVADSCDVLGSWSALRGFKLTYMAIEMQGPVSRSASEAVVSFSFVVVEPRSTVLGQGCARCCKNTGWEIILVLRSSWSKGQDQIGQWHKEKEKTLLFLPK